MARSSGPSTSVAGLRKACFEERGGVCLPCSLRLCGFLCLDLNARDLVPAEVRDKCPCVAEYLMLMRRGAADRPTSPRSRPFPRCLFFRYVDTPYHPAGRWFRGGVVQSSEGTDSNRVRA